MVLNVQHLTWVKVKGGVPQGSILGLLLFLININDLSENLVSKPKLFADNTSLFSVIFDKDLSAKNLNDDLNRILYFQEHLKNMFSKVNRTIGLLRKLHHILQRSSLLTICKFLIIPHLDYGDIRYDQVYNASFHQKIDSIQYNAALATTGAIRGTSKEKLYNKLGLETIEKRGWYVKLCCFFKIFRYKCPQFRFNIIPSFVST